MSEALLKALNSGKAFDKVGETIVVANVRAAAPNKAAKVEIDKPRRMLRAFSQDGQLIADQYPRQTDAPALSIRLLEVSLCSFSSLVKSKKFFSKCRPVEIAQDHLSDLTRARSPSDRPASRGSRRSGFRSS